MTGSPSKAIPRNRSVAFARATLIVVLAALLWSLGCGRGNERTELLVVDQNILHGILNEDPRARPYDRFPERLHVIAAELAELLPDIVFLQEVIAEGGADYGDVRSVLLAALGEEYTAVFGDIAGGPMNTGAIGQMTLTRLPVLSAENHFIGGVRSVHRVTVETENGPLDLYNAHLEGTGAIIEVGPEAPLAEIEDLLAFIQESRTGTAPVILAGDFNAEPGDPSIQALLDAGFIDAMTAGGDPTCVTAGDPGCTSSTIPLGDNPENLTQRRIDYIFVLPGAESSLVVAEAATFLNAPLPIEEGRLLWPSDHIGVQAVVGVN